MTIHAIKKIYFLVLFVSILPSLSSNAQAEGGTGSHGGDTLVGDFKLTSKRLLRTLETMPGISSACGDVKDMKEVMEARYVGSEVTVVLESGDEVTARNWYQSEEEFRESLKKRDPKDIDYLGAKSFRGLGVPRITISRIRFLDMQASIEKQRTRSSDEQNREAKSLLRINLHEHYGLLGVEGTNDFTTSDGCLDALETRKVQFKDIVVHTAGLTSVEARFLEGNAYLECAIEAKSDFPTNPFQMRIVPREPKESDLASGIDVYFRQPNGRWLLTGSIKSLSRERLKEMFRFEYRLLEGAGVFNLDISSTPDRPLANIGGFDYYELHLESLDHVSWNVRFTSDAIYARPYMGTCEMRLSWAIF